MNNSSNNMDDINVRPYRAAGNLNTVISNPSANINDAMNVNIQNMNNNDIPNMNLQQLQSIPPVQNNNLSGSSFLNNTPTDNFNTNMSVNNVQNNNQILNNNLEQNNQNVNNINYNGVSSNEQMVKRTYVNNQNKPKKKSVTLNLGPEFKIALLIIVVLMVFVLFILPIITNID